MIKNDELNSEVVILKNIKRGLTEKIVRLDRSQAMSEHYSHQNNVKLSSISNDISDNKLEETVINICKEHQINVSGMNIEDCHRFSLKKAQKLKILLRIR